MPNLEEILQSGDLHGSLVRAQYIDYQAGENITIEGNVISATDSDTYNAHIPLHRLKEGEFKCPQYMEP